jgi:hypothetical protein
VRREIKEEGKNTRKSTCNTPGQQKLADKLGANIFTLYQYFGIGKLDIGQTKR